MVPVEFRSVGVLAALSLLVSAIAGPVAGAEPNGRKFERVPSAGIDPQIGPSVDR